MNRLVPVILLLAMTTIPATAFAKRQPPKPVKPVAADGVEYHVLHDRFSEGGIPAGIRATLEARDLKSGKAAWSVRLYEIRYDQNLETDVQDVYVTSLRIDGDTLHVTTEKDPLAVDLKTRTVK
jgi:hypothetical protein